MGVYAARVPWECPVGALCVFLLALATTPAGVSGAVLLLPIRLSILHVRSPAVTLTNLLFNVAAVPGGLLRLWHERRLPTSDHPWRDPHTRARADTPSPSARPPWHVALV